jgi:hypothetical protein
MPCGILHVVWIHRPVRFELPAAIVVAAGALPGDTTLPEEGNLAANCI